MFDSNESLLEGLGNQIEIDEDNGYDVDGLGAAAKMNRRIVASAIERMKEPGTVNPTVWSEFKKLILGLPVDLSKVTVEDKEYYDTFGQVSAGANFTTWTAFANRDAAIPGICNLPRGQVLSDRPFLCEAIAFYIPHSLALSGTTLTLVDETNQQTPVRRAFIQQFLDTAEYEFREGNQTMLQGRVAHMTEPPFGPQANHVAALAGPSLASFATGTYRNGMGRVRKLPQPLLFVNGRPNQLTITAPVAIPLASGSAVAIRAAYLGREIRPGGYFAS